MKYILIVLISSVALFSCSKSDNSTSSNTTSLNSTEKNLVGKWYLVSKSDTDIVNGKKVKKAIYNSFQGVPYIDLLTTRLGVALSTSNSSSKNITDSGCNFGNTNMGQIVTGTTEGYWFFDLTGNWFVYGERNLKLVSLSSNNLVIQYLSPVGSTNVWTITWAFRK